MLSLYFYSPILLWISSNGYMTFATLSFIPLHQLSCDLNIANMSWVKPLIFIYMTPLTLSPILCTYCTLNPQISAPQWWNKKLIKNCHLILLIYDICISEINLVAECGPNQSIISKYGLWSIPNWLCTSTRFNHYVHYK